MRKELSDYINKEKLDALSNSFYGAEYDSLGIDLKENVFDKYIELENMLINLRKEESIIKGIDLLKEFSDSKSNSEEKDKEPKDSFDSEKEALTSFLKNIARKI